MKEYEYSSKKGIRNKFKFVGFLLVSLGISLIIYVFFPVLSYYIYLSSAFASSNYQAPVPARFVIRNDSGFTDLITQGISSLTSDYTNADNWFPDISNDYEIGSDIKKIESYTLSIPKLKIDHANVSATDTKLSEHLVQYFTTSSNPAKKGTSVIFGHSTLPQLYKEGNYKTIFANVHTLRTGDEFFITIDGKDYEYRIFSIDIVNSDDPNIFSHSFDNSYITLVTCTPPGTVWKRLVLRASLVNQ